MIEHLRRLFEHMAWADACVLEGLRTSAGSDAQALEYFAHVLAAEHLWLSRIRARSAELAVWPQLTLDQCANVAVRNRHGFADLLAETAPSDLERPVGYRNSAGLDFVSRLDDILYHVALHGAYHRGQVSLMVRRSGGTPVPTDYIAFVRGTPAATRSDAEPAGGR